MSRCIGRLINNGSFRLCGSLIGDLLAGTFKDGVFYSFDGGVTWKEVSAGLPAPTVLEWRSIKLERFF